MTDKKISAIGDIVPVLDMLLRAEKKEFALVCDDAEGEALTTLILNIQRGVIRPVVVKAPAFGELRKQMLLDLAALTGGQVISEEAGRRLDSATLEDPARRADWSPRSARRPSSTATGRASGSSSGSGRSGCNGGARPARTSTARSSRSGWPGCPAAWASSRSARRPRWN